MPGPARPDSDYAYPRLDKAALDVIIASLVMTLRDRELGASQGTYESTLAHMINLRTRRWGLPPILQGSAPRA